VQEWFDHEVASKGYCRLQVTHNEYWMLLPNKNPVLTTHLNIHQLAEITTKQDARITMLEALVAQLTQKGEWKSEDADMPELIHIIESDSEKPAARTRANCPRSERFYGHLIESDSEDEDEYADMPELIDIESADSEDEGEGSTGTTGKDRMRISEELCGNN
jgi:hypothetical protein